MRGIMDKQLQQTDLPKESVHSGQISIGAVIDQILIQNQAVLNGVEISILDLESTQNMPVYRIESRYIRASDLIIKEEMNVNSN